MNDVSHQKHYMDLPLQPIVIMLRDFTRDEFMGFLKGNAIKYLLRADGKNGTEDYAKAAVYTAWVKEFAETGTITVPGAKDAPQAAREWHHFFSDSGSNCGADARFIVNMLEQLFPELRREGVER